MSDKLPPNNTPPLKNIDLSVGKSIDMAARIRGYIIAQYQLEPLEHTFTALLLLAAEIAHSQGMSNVVFRRTARDVYNAAKEEYDQRTHGGKDKPDFDRDPKA